jgi:CRP/FNR family transcriptional regulator, anaerobic regulatory protein
MGNVMLNPAFTFTRPHPDPRPATRPPDVLASSLGAVSGTHPRERTLQALFLPQVAETFAPPRALFWEGDVAGHVFLVLEGCLRLYRIVQDGRRAILGFSYPGDLLGVSSCDLYTVTAEAVTPVRLRRLARHRFNKLVDNSQDLRSQRLAAICSEMTAAQDQIMRLGRTSADERVATFLVDIARRTGADAETPVEIDLPFGRLDIADYLGLTVETVSREISKLNRCGLISMRGPHKIILRRLGRIRDIARMDVDEPGEVRETGAHLRFVNAPEANTAAFSM